MRDHLPKIVIVGLMLLVVGTPFALRALGLADPGADTAVGVAGDRLVIYSPHNEQIRDELSRAFNEYRAGLGLSAVAMEWRTSGGTTDLRRGILSQFEAVADRGGLDAGIGADLFFGGGDYDHGKLAKGVTLEGGERETVAVLPVLPTGLLDEVFPSREIGGEPLIHPEGLWTGTALSSFGIVYNLDLLAMLGLEPPTTWADLGDPRYANWVAMADPGHSGSISKALETVLRREGWTKGWGTLRRIFANSRYFAASATKVPMDVSSGDAAAGMAIDFYGRFQAGATLNEGGAARVGYVDPAVGGVSQTAATSDPITLLRGAPHREVAEQFIAWTLSKEAQRLWQLKLGVAGGPVRYELRRQPIRRDLYTAAEKADWADPELDPFAQALPFPESMPGFFASVAPVSHAMAIDNHEALKAAWGVICETPMDDPRRVELLALFDAMPEDLVLVWPDAELAAQWEAVVRDPQHARYAEAAAVLEAFGKQIGGRDRDESLRDRLRWSAFFRGKYEAIVAMGRE